MTARVVRSLVCAGVAWLVPSAAFAQTATALDRLSPAPSGDGFFAVQAADVKGDLRASMSLVLSYAHDPLSLRLGGATGVGEAGAVVGYQLVAHIAPSLEVGRRLKLDVDVPVTLSQGGESPSFADVAATLPPGAATSYASPEGAAMNDLRLGLRVVLLRPSGFFPAASLSYAVWLPTGDATAYTGTGLVRHAPSIVIGGDYRRINWSLTVGRRLQDAQGGLGLLGGEFFGGMAVAARFGPVSTHVEVFGSTTLEDAKTLGGGSTSLELLLGARYTQGPLTLGLSGGPGLGRGIGTPTFRLLATAGASFDFGSKPGARGASGGEAGEGSAVLPGQTVGSPRSKAKAPPAPPPDRDGDGVPDGVDVCPDLSGEAAETAKRRGCPADRDGDAIADVDDRCPDEAGAASVDPAKFGCPLDTDADGIPDAADACPKERGEATADPKTTGCPASVRLEGTQIVILQEVNFATGSDVIAQESYALLEQVAGVLAQHPEIARVAIDGHTDNRGVAKANVTLSQRRAVSVVRWLVDHGVDARRLEARGFGPRRPIGPNDTDEGRAKNRRVEFQILKRTPLGVAGWKEGAAK